MFEGLIEQVKTKLTIHQILRAKKCISYLRSGAPAFQIKELPPIFCKNVPSTAKHGQLVTDTIAVWIKKGFASGPFESPPLAPFRVNPLIAVEQHGKVRPVLNVSDPVGRSFNDNVDRNGVEKVYMSSAKDFGYSLCKAVFQQISANLIFQMLIKIFHVSPQILEYKVFIGWGDIFLSHNKFLVRSPQ